MNGQRYATILSDYVIPHFSRHRELLFQQDGAPCHYATEVRRILDESLPGQWIGRRGPIEWPARSPDLTACDYFLWSYLRSKVYDPVGTIFDNIDELTNKIQQEIRNIPIEMFRRSLRDFQKRVELCLQANGGHFE